MPRSKICVFQKYVFCLLSAWLRPASFHHLSLRVLKIEENPYEHELVHGIRKSRSTGGAGRVASFYPRALRTKIKTVTAPNVFRHSSILSITVLSHVSKDSALYVLQRMQPVAQFPYRTNLIFIFQQLFNLNTPYIISWHMEASPKSCLYNQYRRGTLYKRG